LVLFFRLFAFGPNQRRKGEAKKNSPEKSRGENKLISVLGEVEGEEERREQKGF